MQEVPVQIDEELLTQISEETGGNYYRAKKNTDLENIFKEIDQLEKSKVSTLDYKVNPPEKYYGMLMLGILLIVFHKTVNHTLLKSIP